MAEQIKQQQKIIFEILKSDPASLEAKLLSKNLYIEELKEALADTNIVLKQDIIALKNC